MVCIQSLVSFCQFVLRALGDDRNLTSVRGRGLVAGLQKKTTMVYLTNVDLVNDSGCAGFDLILSIRSRVVGWGPDSGMGRLLCYKFAKGNYLQYQCGSCQ